MKNYQSEKLHRIIFAKKRLDFDVISGGTIPIGFYGHVIIGPEDEVELEEIFKYEYLAPGTQVIKSIPIGENYELTYRVDDISKWRDAK